ncbi:MAG: GNAT family N-acetyltransferase [Chitinophagaceae bacterium]
MITLLRTSAVNPDFAGLVRLLDADLAEKDGQEHGFYSQFNKIDHIKDAVVAYHKNQPVACGAIKAFDSAAMEVKRMYTLPQYRGKGIAGKILAELETWAAELSFKKCLLETGKRQPAAISLYEKKGYKVVANYGQYAGIDNSICFEKKIL